MAPGKHYQGQDCSLARALEVVGERWTMLVLRDTLFGVRRFTDLLNRLDIPRAVLVERLTTLVDAGLLERRPYRPGRDEYLPTEPARALWPAIYALVQWSEQYRPAAGGPRRLYRHTACDGADDADGGGPARLGGTAPGPARLGGTAPAPARLGGTDLDADGRCPNCRRYPDPAELETRPGPGSTPGWRDDPVSRALREPHQLLTPLP
jgi:DNA-binding HxlR family transcriptional regulator